MTVSKKSPAEKNSARTSNLKSFARISDPIFAFDTDFYFTYVNKEAAQILGLKPSELLGKSISTEIPNGISPSLTTFCQKAFDKKRPTSLEEFNPTNNSWFEYHFYPSNDGITVLCKDITKHKLVEQETIQQNKELKILNTLALAVNQSIDLPIILNIALVETLSSFGGNAGLFYLFDPESQVYNYVAQNGISEKLLREVTSFKIGQGLSGQAAESGKVLVINSLTEDQSKIYQLAIQENWNSYVGIPIKNENRVVGVMVLLSHQPGYFNPDHISILDNIGNHIGLAIWKAQLYKTVEHELVEKKRVENAFEEQNQLLSTMSQMAKIGAWEFDAKTLQGTWTEETARIQDVDPEDETNVEKGLNFFQGKSRKKIEDAVRDAIDKGIPYDLELVLVSAKGNHKWVRTIGKPIKQGTRVVKIQGTIQDISELKLADELLRQSEERYRFLFENNPHPMWIYDLKTLTFLAANDAAIDKYGYSRDEFLCMTLADIHPSDDVPRLLENIAQERPTLQHSGEWRHCLKDGSVIDVEITSHTLKIGQQDSVLFIAQDITEKKQVIEAIRHSEAQYRLLAENMSDTVWLLDINLDTIYVSPSVTRLRGFTLNEINETPREQQMTPESLTRAMRLLSDALSPENFNQSSPRIHFPIELEFYRKDGSTFWSDNTYTLILDQNGSPINILGIGRDITERKIAEVALRQNEFKFRKFVEESSDGLMLIDELGAVVEWNRSLEELTGITRESVLGEPYWEIQWRLIPEERRSLTNTEKIKSQIEQALVTGESTFLYHPIEVEFQRPDGEKRFTLQSTFPIKTDSGYWLGATARDITDKKIAENSLRESEERYRNLIDISPDGISVHQDGKIVFTNLAGALLLGAQSPEELIGKPISEIVHPDNWDESKKRIQRILNKETDIYPIEDKYIRLDGTTIDVEVLASPLLFNNKPAIQVIVRDITGRKQAEENLRQSEDKFFKAFQTSPNIIVITRLSDGIVIDVNDAFINYTGYTREEVLGVTREEINLWVDRSNLERYLEQLQTKHHVRDMEARFRMKLGQILDCQISGDVIKLNGELCVLSTILDISERKHQEAQIERQLQRLSALRSIDVAISSSFDLHITFEILLDHLTTQLNVDAALVLSLNPTLNSLEIIASRGFRYAGITKQQIRLGKDLANQAILERRLVSIPDLTLYNQPSEKAKLIDGEEFSSCFAAPLLIKGMVKGVLEVFHRTPLDPDPEWLSFLEAIAGQTAISIDNSELFQGLQHSNTELMIAYDSTIEGWSAALDLRDKETEGHSQRVLNMTLKMARILGISDKELVHVRRGALLHDIGKLGVPDNILLKPGSLTSEEWEIMKKHPTFAYEMLSPITYLHSALDIPYYHHEKWDGTGYPNGLMRELIPLTARIFALVDVWDALRSDRPYRPAWTEEKALEYIRNQSGKHFDPQVVEAFFDLLPSFEEQNQ